MLRAVANRANRLKITQPATPPSSVNAVAAMARTHRPWMTLPAVQAHFRTCRARIWADMNNCGSKANDSLTGTSRPMTIAGAPRAPSSQARTSFGSTNPSPVLDAARLTICVRKFSGCCLQAESGISLQMRSSSSPVKRS